MRIHWSDAVRVPRSKPNFIADMTIRYWDELHDIVDMTASELWKDEYFGGDGTGPGGCVETGPFRNLTLRWTRDGNVESHCLTRHFSTAELQMTNQENIDKCNGIQNYTDAWVCWFGVPSGSSGPHAAGHAAVGGAVRSPFPSFSAVRQCEDYNTDTSVL